MSFAQSPFARFISSGAGRALRVIVGGAIIWYGSTQLPATLGFVLIVVGVVPVAAGVLNWCLISALLGGPLRGAEILGQGKS